MLARIGGKSSGEAGLLKRVLRYDAATKSFLWCSAKRYVQDAAAALQVIGQSHKCKMGRHTWHDGHWRDSETETRSSTRTKLPPSGASWDE